jgi:hypothetical protein
MLVIADFRGSLLAVANRLGVLCELAATCQQGRARIFSSVELQPRAVAS